MPDKQVVGIVGLGPIGTILGAYLAKSGVRVYGVEATEARLEQVKQHGFRVRGFVEIEGKPLDCFSSLDELAKVKELSAIFLCTKTWAIRNVMPSLVKHDWPEEMRIVACMNGIGPEDAVGEFIDKERVSRAVINFAGNVHEDGFANMNWFHPPNLIGPATERTTTWSPLLEQILNGAGLTTVQVPHRQMKKQAFYKTILNAALNALCAAHGLTMAQAMRLKHTRRTARVLMREGLTVAGLIGYNYGEDTLDRCMAYLDAGGEHYPSMWFDLREKRPTEIEYINGKIVKISRMFNDVDVSLNAFFTSAIITQEIRNGNRAEDDIPDYLVNR